MADGKVIAGFSSYMCNRCNRDALEQGPEFYDAPSRSFGGRWGIICHKCRYIAQSPGTIFNTHTREKIGNIDQNWMKSTFNDWQGQACPEEME